jgi:predicted nucleotidyltransferase
MTTPRERALLEVKRMVLEALQGCPARVYLFGSCATEAARRYSDIDVAIDPFGSLPPRALPDLREALEESHVPYDVDVVDLSAAPPELRERVRHEGVLWSG